MNFKSWYFGITLLMKSCIFIDFAFINPIYKILSFWMFSIFSMIFLSRFNWNNNSLTLFLFNLLSIITCFAFLILPGSIVLYISHISFLSNFLISKLFKLNHPSFSISFLSVIMTVFPNMVCWLSFCFFIFIILLLSNIMSKDLLSLILKVTIVSEIVSFFSSILVIKLELPSYLI